MKRKIVVLIILIVSCISVVSCNVDNSNNMESDENYEFVYNANSSDIIKSDEVVGEIVLKECTKEESIKSTSVTFWYKQNNKWVLARKENDSTFQKVDGVKQYEIVNRCSNNYFKVKFDGKWGVVDSDGKSLIEPKYDKLVYLKENLFYIKSKAYTAFINQNEKEVFSANNYDIHWIYEGIVSIYDTSTKKYGFVNFDGDILIKPKYDKVNFRHRVINNINKPYYSVVSDEKYGLVDSNGVEVIAPKYERSFQFRDGLASVYLNGKYGYIGRNGKVKLPYIYDMASVFNGGTAYIKIKEEWILIDKLGKRITPSEYQEIRLLYGAKGITSSIFKANVNGKWRIIHKDGTEASTKKYDEIHSLKEGFLKGRNGDKWGLVKPNGEEITNFKFDDISCLNGRGLECVLIAKINDKYTIIDENGEDILQGDKYDRMGYSIASMSGINIKLNDKYGYMLSDGTVIIEPKYDFIVYNKDLEIVEVKLDGKVGIIDKNGREIVPLMFDDVLIVK